MRSGTQLSGINNYQYMARRSCLTLKCKCLNMGSLTLQDQSNANSKEECKGKTSSLFINERCRGCQQPLYQTTAMTRTHIKMCSQARPLTLAVPLHAMETRLSASERRGGTTLLVSRLQPLPVLRFKSNLYQILVVSSLI